MFPKKKLSWMFLVGLMLEDFGDAFLSSRLLRRKHPRPSRGVVVDYDSIYSQLPIPLPVTFLRETSKDGGGADEETPKEQLTPDMVAEMVEVSFVNACLQLARGYVDVLKLFIVAVKAGYELHMDAANVIQRVDNVPLESAGRALMAEEIKLRNTWIHCIFLLLETIKHETRISIKDGDRETEVAAAMDYCHVPTTFSSDLLTDMKDRHDNGEAFQLDALLAKYSFPNMDDPVEKAIVSQSLRVIWCTFTVLEEEKQCLEEKSGLKAQPPIPGAFE